MDRVLDVWLPKVEVTDYIYVRRCVKQFFAFSCFLTMLVGPPLSSRLKYLNKYGMMGTKVCAEIHGP